MSDLENLAEWHESRGDVMARLAKASPDNVLSFTCQAANHFAVAAGLRARAARVAEPVIAVTAPPEPAIQPPAAPIQGKRKPRT